MGWQENVKRIIDFRLIEPDFDGDSELRGLLGIKSSVTKNDSDVVLDESKLQQTPDEVTLRMIEYLKNGIKEK